MRFAKVVVMAALSAPDDSGAESSVGCGPVSGREVVLPLRDYLLALDEAVRGSAPEPELPARFRDLKYPEMWDRNVAALRNR